MKKIANAPDETDPNAPIMTVQDQLVAAPAGMNPDQFTTGFVEAMFFTDGGTDGEVEGATEDDLAPEAMQDILKDCAAFQSQNHALLAQAYLTGYDPVQAGRDFALSRNGHGAGYWDREELEQDNLGDHLHAAAMLHGQMSLYRGDDGKVYVYAG